MRVGIYVEAIKAEHHTGISRYVKRLIETLVDLADSSVTYYLYYQLGPNDQKLTWLSDKKNVVLRPLWTPVDLVGERPRVWWSIYLPLILKIDRINVFHGPNHFIPLKGSVPSIVTIHDIAYYFMPVHGAGMDKLLQNWTNKSLHAATKICAVSQSTANDICAQGIAADKVKVIYQGYEPKTDTTPQVRSNYIAGLTDGKPYFLFIGTIQPRKNVEYIITEFSKLSAQLPHKLILAGAAGDSLAKVQALIKASALEDRVVITGFISDDERSALYRQAEIFLYPSLYEGFGLVILEAMSYGIPVIAGNNSAMPEAAGEAAILVDINKSGALAAAITSLCQNEELKQDLIAKGLERAKAFSWLQAAQHMLALYKKVYLTKRQG